MLNVIPAFISNMIGSGVYRGTFRGSLIDIDINGFTAMTEELMNEGRHGAEAVSGMLNSVFHPCIRKIHQEGAFVASFEGDSFTVVLPEVQAGCADRLKDILEGSIITAGRAVIGQSEYSISARSSIWHGTIEWGIPGSNSNRCYYFRRNELPGQDREGKKGRGFESGSRVAPGAARLIVPEAVIRMGQGGEFREVVPLFISFAEPEDWEELNDFARLVLEECRAFGGYFAGLYFGDKGPIMLIVFGAPVSYESNAGRAASLALQVIASSRIGCRAAFTQGIAFAGVVGSRSRCTYTVIGDTVNTAARLAMKAAWGELLHSERSGRSISGDFRSRQRRSARLRGKSRRVKVFSIVERLECGRDDHRSELMFGRSEEIALIRGKIDRLLEEGSFQGICYLYGEAGAGKSLLVRKAAEGYEEKCRILIAESDEVLRKSLNPVIYLLRRLFGQESVMSGSDPETEYRRRHSELVEELRALKDPLAGEIAGEIERTGSLIGALLGHFREGSMFENLPAKARFENTVLAIKAIIKGLCILQPLILVIEDIQWLDSDTRRVLGSLARNIEGFPLLILATSRYEDDGSPPVLEVDDDVPVGTVALKELERQHAERLAEHVTGGIPDRGLADFIEARCGCNPFYIRQFCLFMLENGFLATRDGISHLQGSPNDIPSSIRSVLVARLDRLKDTLRELVQTASVLGREFNVRILSRMLSTGDIRDLVDSSELRTVWRPLSDIIYFFRHDLLREAAYGMLLVKSLRRLHGQAGKALEGLFGSQPEMLADIAYHFEKAGMTLPAIEYLGRAAEYARRFFRNHQAMDLLGRRARLLDRGSPEMAETQYELAVLESITGRWDDAEARLERELRSAADNGFANVEIRMLRELSTIISKRGRTDEALGLLEMAVERARASGDESQEVLAKMAMGNCYVDMARHEDAALVFRDALEIATSAGDRRSMATVNGAMGRMFTSRGSYGESLECLERAVALAETSGNSNEAMVSSYNLGVVHYLQGQREKGLRAFEKTLEIARKRGDIRNIMLSIGSIGTVHADRGDHDAALRFQEEKLRMARELNDKMSILYALGNIGMSQTHMGLHEEALESYLEYRDLALDMNAVSELCMVMGLMGSTYARIWDYESAEECYTRELEIAREIDEAVNTINALRNMGWVQREKGEWAGSRESLERALELAEEMDSSVEVSICCTSLCDLEMMKGDLSAAEEYARRSLELSDELGDVPEQASILGRLAEISYRMGLVTAAEEYARQSKTKAMDCSFDEALWSSCMLLARIRARTDPEASLAMLEELQSAADTPDREAELLSAIYSVSADEDIRNRAVSIYRDLLERTGSETFRQKLKQII